MTDTDDDQLQNALLEFSEDAVRLYSSMSGLAPSSTPEGFIRDWCAVSLYQKLGRIIAIETKREDYRDWSASPGTRTLEAYDRFGNFKIDLLVFDPQGDDPTNAILRALVEFKTNPNPRLVAQDVQRTRHLVAAAKAGFPDHERVFGYQVICVGSPNPEYRDIDKRNMFGVEGVLGELSRFREFEIGDMSCAVFGLLARS